jgi:hypothetical protein
LLGLLLISSLFTAYMKILSFDSKFGMQISKFSMDLSTLIFLGYQLVMARMIINHPVNNTIYSILYMLLLSSVISIAEVSFVSWDAAIIILIFWVVIIATIANTNREVIYNIDSVVSNIIQIFMYISFILNLIYMFYCIVHSYVILLSLVPKWVKEIWYIIWLKI